MAVSPLWCDWCGHLRSDHRPLRGFHLFCNAGVSDGRDGGDHCGCNGGPRGDFTDPGGVS